MKRGAAFAGLVLAVLIAAVLFRDRISADLWPLDSSRVGPNLVASVVQWVIVIIVASFVYPPLRHWIERELDRAHAKLDAHHDEVLELMRKHHAAHMKAIKQSKEIK